MAIYTDDFNRANANPLDGSWAKPTGVTPDFLLASNVVGGAGSSGARFVYNTGTVGNDQFSAAICSTIDDGDIGVAVRVQTGSFSGYSFANRTVANGGWIMERYDSGSPTTLAEDTARGGAANDAIRIDALGNLIFATVNGYLALIASDSTYTSGHVGMWAFNTTSRLDDWAGGDTAWNTTGTGPVSTAMPGAGPLGAGSVGLFTRAVATAGHTAVATDSITLSDSALADVVKVASASDSITLSDSAVSFTNRIAVATDSITLSDSAVAGSSLPASATDSITLSDSATADVNKVATAADSITLSDSALADVSKVASASDTITLSDSALADVIKVAEAVDSITLSDSAVASISGAITATATDSITLSDSAVADVVKVANASDTISLSDSATADVQKVATATDSIILTDSATALTVPPGGVTAVAEDSIFLSDSAVAIKVSGAPVPSQGGGKRKPAWTRRPTIEEPVELEINAETDEEMVFFIVAAMLQIEDTADA